MDFWTPERRAEQKSVKRQDDDRFLRIQKRLLSDPATLSLWRENADNPASLRICWTCKMLCDTPKQMIKHEGTEECKERKCKNEGVEYVPPPLPRCEVCSKNFKNKFCLKQHLTTTIHKKQVRILEKGPDIFFCKKCDQTFTSKRGLKKHIGTKKHKQTPESFHCTACDKTFTNKKCLKQHETRKSHRVQVALANIVSMSRKR